MSTKTQSFYGQDLASIHDRGFGELAQSAAPLLTRTLARQGFRTGNVVDLGCGGGVLLAAARKAGFTPHGVEVSAAALALARKRVPGGHFTLGSIHKAKLPGAAGVAAIGEVVNYLADKGSLPALFKRVFAALEPGGVFLLDSAGPRRAPAEGTLSVHQEADWFVASETRWERKDVLERHVVTFVKAGKGFRRSEETHRLQVFPHAQVSAWLRAAGFRVGILRSYNPRESMPPDLRVFVCIKQRR